VNLREISDVAVLLGAYGFRPQAELGQAYQDYLKYSRLRLQLWMIEPFAKSSPGQLATHLEDCLVSELVSRVAAGACLASSSEFTSSTAAFQLIRQYDSVRERFERLIMASQSTMRDRLKTERLYRKLKRWTDLLLSPQAAHRGVKSLAHDHQRCLDFHEGGTLLIPQESQRREVMVLMASLRAAIPNRQVVDSRHAACQSHMLGALLQMLPQRAFEIDGSPHPLAKHFLLQSEPPRSLIESQQNRTDRN